VSASRVLQRPDRLWVDLPLAVAFGGFGLLISPDYGLGTGGVPALLVMVAALAVRRVAPAVALALAWASAVVQMATLHDPGYVQLGTAAVVYACAAYGRRPLVVAAAASGVAGTVVAVGYLVLRTRAAEPPAVVVESPSSALAVGVASFAVLGLGWVSGLLVRVAAQARDSRERREQAEREAATAREIAGLEQSHAELSREVHDVVGHSLAVIVAQADSVRFLPRDDRDAVARAVETIADTARGSLAEVRAVLSRLETRPPVDLDAMVRRVEATGRRVVRTTEGEPRPLPEAVEHVRSRVVQEMLTNAVRHGAPGPVRLDERWSGDGLRVVVRNPVADRDAETVPGYGTVGMRARLAEVGGSLLLRRDGDEFRAQAFLPLGGAA
jgi:signal transduction histidine kinase